jgi:hypothetical protein
MADPCVGVNEAARTIADLLDESYNTVRGVILTDRRKRRVDRL